MDSRVRTKGRGRYRTTTMKNYKALMAIALSSAMLLWLPPRTSACGPYFEEAIFTRPDHPDYPLTHFAQGQLGVIQPTYARSYLVVAYRYLNGAPLAKAEQDAAVALWNERLNRNENPDERGIRLWSDARNRIPSAPQAPEINSPYRSLDQKDNYGEYLNCAPDSFHSAADTLS